MSFCHKLSICNPYIFATLCHRPLIFHTLHYVGWNIVSLKYQRSTPSGLQRYRNSNIWVCGKNSIPLIKIQHLNIISTCFSLPPLFWRSLPLLEQEYRTLKLIVPRCWSTNLLHALAQSLQARFLDLSIDRTN